MGDGLGRLLDLALIGIARLDHALGQAVRGEQHAVRCVADLLEAFLQERDGCGHEFPLGR